MKNLMKGIKQIGKTINKESRKNVKGREKKELKQSVFYLRSLNLSLTLISRSSVILFPPFR